MVIRASRGNVGMERHAIVAVEVCGVQLGDKITAMISINEHRQTERHGRAAEIARRLHAR